MKIAICISGVSYNNDGINRYRNYEDAVDSFNENVIDYLTKEGHDVFTFLYTYQTIKTNDILEAYNSLIPCSYKSDLWRFCVLYKNGGIYMDIKYKCVNNFKLIALTEKEYFVKDRPINMTYTALIVVKPENPIMLKCINQIVDNVKHKYYGKNALEPTGPGLLGRYFTKPDFETMELYFTDTTTAHFKKEYMVFLLILILLI